MRIRLRKQPALCLSFLGLRPAGTARTCAPPGGPVPLTLRRWKARPRAGSCSPLSRSSWWDWKSGSPAAGTSHPRAGAPGQPLQPEPSSAPATGLGTEASPLLSPQPRSLAGEGTTGVWVARELPPARFCAALPPSAPALPPQLPAGPGPGFPWQAGWGRGWHVPCSCTLPVHPDHGGTEGAPPWGLPSCSRPRACVGRGKDAGRACQGDVGGQGDPSSSPLCIQLCSLQLSPAPALAASSRIGGPEPIQQQRQEPSTSCRRRRAAPSLTSTPASVSLPGRGLGAEPGPGTDSNHCRDLVEKPPGEKPLKQGLSPSPNTEIPLSQRCSWEVG